VRKSRGYAGANQLSLRRGNRSVILRAVWTLKRISRIELASKTGLHPATITHIVDELVSEGLLKESKESVNSENLIGRPAQQLEVNPEAAFVVGVNVNRDSISAGLVDLNGNILQRVSFGGLQVQNDNKYIKSRLLQSIEIILEEAALADRKLVGIGVGAPEREYLTPLHRRLNPISATPVEIQEQTLGEFISARFGMPVVVDHNANTLALDLQYFGEIGDISNFVLIRCGFGIGGSIVLNHEIYYPNHGGSSELGHLSVDTNGPKCRCGNTGCLELYCSVPAILERTAPDLNLPAAVLTVEQVAAAYHDGQIGVINSIRTVSKYLSYAVINTVNTIAPDAIVITGPLGPLAPILAELVQAQIRPQVYPTLAEYVNVIGVSQPGGPVQGAAMLIIRNVLNTGRLDFTGNSTLDKEANIAG
jgi:N-acetylglucosamine repressor